MVSNALIRVGPGNDPTATIDEHTVWSAVHGFAVLALTGPLKASCTGDIDAALNRLLDNVVHGFSSPR